MLPIICKGKGLIPRVGMIAPIFTPFKVDLQTLTIIMKTPGSALQPHFVDPATSIQTLLTNTNWKNVYEKYQEKLKAPSGIKPKLPTDVNNEGNGKTNTAPAGTTKLNVEGAIYKGAALTTDVNTSTNPSTTVAMNTNTDTLVKTTDVVDVTNKEAKSDVVTNDQEPGKEVNSELNNNLVFTQITKDDEENNDSSKVLSDDKVISEVKESFTELNTETVKTEIPVKDATIPQVPGNKNFNNFNNNNRNRNR